jgi:hypothetical protein
MLRRRRNRDALTALRLVKPYVDEGKEPLEVLCVLAGRAAFVPEIHDGDIDGLQHQLRYPFNAAARLGLPRIWGVSPPTLSAGSRSTWSTNRDVVTPLDVAAALGTHRDRAGAELARAIACQDQLGGDQRSRLLDALRARVMKYLSPRCWRSLGRRGGRQVDHDAHRAANRHRIRIVLWDVFHDLIRPEHRQDAALAAKACRIRRADYQRLYREIEGILLHTANNAARRAVEALSRRTSG